MKILRLTILLFVIAFAEEPPQYSDALEQTVSAIFEDRFDDAIKICDSLSIIYPQDPTPRIFSIIAKASRMQDSEDYSSADALWSEITKVDSLCIAVWGEMPSSPWCAFAYGSLVGYRAILGYFLERSGLYTVWRDAEKAASLFEIAMLDSAAGNEAANGLGVYYYWFSANAGLLRTFGIIGDRRDEGIALLKRSAEKSRISKDSAMHSLVFILFDTGDTASAIEYTQRLITRHPTSRTAKWDMLFANYLTANWSEAIAISEELLSYYRGKSDFNVCQLSIISAQSAYELGDIAACKKYLIEVEKLSKDKKIKAKLKRRELWDVYEELVKNCEH